MSDFCTVGLSLYAVKAAQRFISLDWPEPEPFDGDAGGDARDAPAGEAYSSGPDMIEENHHAA